jgi:hypothetical protein
MEIIKEVRVKLTTNDLKKIIIEHLKNKGVNVKSVHFNVKGHNRDDNHFAQYSLEYRLDDVLCIGEEIK